MPSDGESGGLVMKLMVAFASPKRSAKVVEVAATHAKLQNAELVLVRVVPDPQQVGVVAQLVASKRPEEKADAQIEQVVGELKSQGVNASGMVKIGAVAKTIIQTAKELQVDMLYVGSSTVETKPFYLTVQDPIVHYLVDNCPMGLCIVRHNVGREVGDG
jgi:nucleotide-binding universal stress UspA family protein